MTRMYECQSLCSKLNSNRIQGAYSVMIARAAESNPSCFSPELVVDVENNLVPQCLRLVRCASTTPTTASHTTVTSSGQIYDNHWSLTKFCIAQFKAKSEAIQANDLPIKRLLDDLVGRKMNPNRIVRSTRLLSPDVDGRSKSRSSRR